MAVQLRIPYDTLRELVKQLPPDEREQLLSELLQSISSERPLTKKERYVLLDAMKSNQKVQETPSIRRENWYGDDGR